MNVYVKVVHSGTIVASMSAVEVVVESKQNDGDLRDNLPPALTKTVSKRVNGERVNSSLTFHQHIGHTETGPRVSVSFERPEKRRIDPLTP